MPTTEDLYSHFDNNHIWHPYNSVPSNLPAFLVGSAEGVRIKLAGGRQLVDGMSSWWSAIHGYNHPKLNDAITRQIKDMAHVMFGGLTHRPAIDLCERLLSMTHKDLDKVFISDSGSVAVEIAIKMAMQYWQARGCKQKQQLMTVASGYHGDTFAAMSVCDPLNGMHHLFTGMLAPQIFADVPACKFGQPWRAEHIENFAALLAANDRDLAAVILEPIVQGAGGMRFYSPEYLRQVRKLCSQHNVLLILDEIATGFGRSGKLFAYEHADVCPDIMCVGKALTGGYMSLAATLCTEEVSDIIGSGEPGLFMHGPTFMANPLACSVAASSLDLLVENDWQKQVADITAVLEAELPPARDLPGVADVRILGAIGVIELDRPVDMQVIQPLFVENGVWIRPFGKLVYTMPPYIISEEDLRFLCRQMVTTVAQYLTR